MRKTTIHIHPGSDLDRHLKANRANTRFILEPGHYHTGTGWAFDEEFDHCVLGTDCELIGAGSDKTWIHASISSIPVPPNAKQVEVFTAGSRSAVCLTTRIEGVGIACGGIGDVTSLELGTVGLHTWSDQAFIKDVAIYGVTGFRPDKEGFGVLVNRPGVSLDENLVGGSIIQDVTVSSSGGYVCGVYIGYTDPRVSSVARNIIVNSWSKPSHAAFGTNGGVLWSNVQNTGRWNRAVFCDTDGGEGTIFSASRLQAEDVIVEFRGATGTVWKDILVTDSILQTTASLDRSDRTYAAALVLARDGARPGPSFSNVGIQNCVIRATAPCNHFSGSIDSPGSDNGIFHSRLIGPWKPPVVVDGAVFREYGILKS